MAVTFGLAFTPRGHACLALMVAALLGAGAFIYSRYAPRAAEYL